MRVISRLSFEAGTSTTSCWAWIALRIRVRKSATGSVMDMLRPPLPARLGHAGDVAVVGELAQADPADAELAVHGARAAAAAAPAVLPRLVLRSALLADDLRGLGHGLALLLGRRAVGAHVGVALAAEGHPEHLE